MNLGGGEPEYWGTVQVTTTAWQYKGKKQALSWLGYYWQIHLSIAHGTPSFLDDKASKIFVDSNEYAKTSRISFRERKLPKGSPGELMFQLSRTPRFRVWLCLNESLGMSLPMTNLCNNLPSSCVTENCGSRVACEEFCTGVSGRRHEIPSISQLASMDREP